MENLLIGRKTRKHLALVGLPGSDMFALPTSNKEFQSGGHFGIEISSVNNLNILKKIVKLADIEGITIDRIDECRGIMRLPDYEIREMVDICAERQIGLVMAVGPRATYDCGGFSKTKNGARIGYRLRGVENIVKAIEDIKRALALGVYGFLIYDEGLLYSLNTLRYKGILPEESVFKVSVHCGSSNPASCLLYEKIGADTINLVPDLEMSMLSATRATITCPIDLFTDTAGDAGGLIRTYDVPEFIRVASPVYLKCGPVSQKKQNHLPSDSELAERIKQTALVVYTIKKYGPGFSQVNKKERSLAVPVPVSE